MARYSSGQQLLHWLTVALMLAILPVAWVVVSLKEDTPPFYFYLDIHKSLGLTILLLTLIRIIARAFRGPPPYPVAWPASSRVMARLTALALLVMLIAMPVSGYLWTTGHGYDVAPFDLIRFPRLAWNNRALGDAAKAFHQVGQWIVYSLIGVHIAGVVFHMVVRRDGALDRMLPAQDGEEFKS
jgi:cytochrome b561